MMAIRAFYTGEAFAQISAIEVFANNMRNDRPIKTVLPLKEIVIALLELEKVMIEKLPQGGLLWFPSPVYFDLAAVFHTAPLLPARELS
ncbi:MAG: hypothetical protein PF495_05325 [Spirochaetales bacterium]|jgi:hypothetical protein|nr:hypothetical protein [Spirochaetales bacterium]